MTNSIAADRSFRFQSQTHQCLRLDAACDDDAPSSGIMASSTAARRLTLRARRTYRELLLLAPRYPDPSYDLSARTRSCFRSTAARLAQLPKGSREHEDELAKAVAKAQYIKKEVEATCFLSRYRELRRRYGDARDKDDYAQPEEGLPR